jgi:hypothetical protein
LPDAIHYELAGIQCIYNFQTKLADAGCPTGVIRVCLCKGAETKMLEFTGVRGLRMEVDAVPRCGPKILDVSASGMEGLSVYFELSDEGVLLLFHAAAVELM